MEQEMAHQNKSLFHITAIFPSIQNLLMEILIFFVIFFSKALLELQPQDQ